MEIEQFTFISAEAQNEWRQMVEEMRNLRGEDIIRFAARWAHLMEKELAKGCRIEDVVESARLKAEDEFPHCVLSFACAVVCLYQVWKHGESLRKSLS